MLTWFWWDLFLGCCESSSILCLTPRVWPYQVSNESTVFSKVLPPWTAASVSSVLRVAAASASQFLFSADLAGIGRSVSICMCRFICSKWEECIWKCFGFLHFIPLLHLPASNPTGLGALTLTSIFLAQYDLTFCVNSVSPTCSLENASRDRVGGECGLACHASSFQGL